MKPFKRKGGVYRKARAPMENKAAFQTFWKKNCREEPLPELLELFDSQEGLQERVDLCKQNLNGALCIFKKEGLLLRFLSKVLDTNDYDDFKGEVCGTLRLVFSDSLAFASDVNDLQIESSNELCSSANGGAERSSENEPLTEEHFLIHGDSFAFTIDPKIKEQDANTCEKLENESESGPDRGGSESHLQATADLNESPDIAHSHSSTKTSAGQNVELLTKPNDKVFLGRESLPNVDINYVLSNEDGEFGNEADKQVLMAARDSEQIESMDAKNCDSEASNLREDVKAIGSVPLNTVCGPFKARFMPKERKCEWNIDKPSKEDRLHLCGSYELPADTEMTNPSETKAIESHKPEDGNKSQNMEMECTERRKSKDDGDFVSNENMNSNQECVGDSSIKGDGANEVKNLNLSDHEDRPTLAEEETFFDSTEEKEALDSPDVIDQGTGIVDDLISYLEGIEMENSSEEEGDSASESSSSLPFGYQAKPNDIFRKKQLQSVMSTTSALSGDSCLSPWALDMAMAEIHSADSSDQEDTQAASSEPSPIGASSKVLNDTSGNDDDRGSRPPVRPPRKRSSKGMVRAHTVGTPKEIKPSIRGYSEEDEVFRKEEEGYDGDQENQALSQSHANISTIKDPSVQLRSLLDTGEDERRKLRRSRGSNVILDQDNVDFPSSPLSSPNHNSKNISADELTEDDAKKLQNRKWVASAVVDSEKAYLECLSILHKYVKPLKASLATSAPILSTHDFKKIFFKVEELFKIHDKFYNDLEVRVSNWNFRQIIGDLFLSLVYQFEVYREYIQNYKTAMDTIHKCKSNEQFNQIFSKEIKLKCSQEVTTLESLFSKPVDRVGRYVTALSDLLNQTPDEHPDYGIILEVQVVTQEFLVKVTGGDQKDGPPVQRVKRDHRLIKDGFLVELSDGIRKFRHIFLFNDVLLCTKRKMTARQEQYVCKWHIPLSYLTFHPHDNSEAAQMVPVASEADFDLLKGRIVSLKSEIRKEQGATGQGSSPDESPSTKRKRAQSTNKTIEKLKKKLVQQEAALLLAIPSLPLHLYHKQTPKTYTLLCKSDIEKSEWKESILFLIKQGQDNLPGGHLSVLEVQSLLEACKKLRTCKTLGKVSIEEDKELLNGLLYVYIQNGKGFHRSDLYCVLEVDHYGQFVRKAKTKICKAAGDPAWNQDFDIEVEGSKELKIHVFGKSRYALMSDEECGHGKITLTRENLTDQKKRTITIALDKQGAVTLSIQYSKTLQGIQRKKSVSDSGVFGVDIATVTCREKCDIPLIVIGCVREVEKRGTCEVGIYRLSGASSDVRRLKDAFNENSQSALIQILDADIHAVSGLLKSYLRELPEPLFTDQLYSAFVDAYGISDKEEKKDRMLELLDSLPTANKLTAVYLFEHLRRVGACSDVNKMGLNNLATVFGPNVLRPSPKTSSPMDLSQGTLDVMSQVGIFLYFLKSDSVNTRLPDDPELKNRLDPNRSTADDVRDRLI